MFKQAAKILRDFKNLFLGTGVSSLLIAGYTVVIARTLGPKDYGIWSMLMLVLVYGEHLHLGLGSGMSKEICFYRGKGQKTIVSDIRNTAFSSIMLISMISCIILFSLATIFLSSYGSNLLIASYLVAVALSIKHINTYLRYYFTAETRFDLVSKIKVFTELIAGIFVIVLIGKLRFVGCALAIVLGQLIVLAYMFVRYKPTVNFQINLKRTFSLIKIGFPIVAIFFSLALFFTVERIAIFKCLGAENVGYYNIALMAVIFLTTIPLSLKVVMLPRLSEQYGVTENYRDVNAMISKPSVILVYCMFLLAIAGYFLLPFFVKRIIPLYASGIAAARMALIGTMFLSASMLSQAVLIAINRSLSCLMIIFFGIIVKVVLIYIFIINQTGIVGVAVAANIAYAIYSIFLLTYTFYLCREKVSRLIKYFLLAYSPVVCLLILFAIFKGF